MSLHPAFTPEQWERAPQYTGPGNAELHELCDATILDFSELNALALGAEEADAFEVDERGVAKAPLKLGHLPAAFYKVTTADFDVAAVHMPAEPEILVVLDGVLSVRNSRQAALGVNVYDTALFSGEVRKLGGKSMVEMRALGLFDTPTSLAISVFLQRTNTDTLVIGPSTPKPKKVKPLDTKLPYLPKVDPHQGLM